jgi:hypothetical protein
MLRFFRDQRFNAPSYESTDDSFTALGSLLTSDVQNVDKWALDLLDAIAQVDAGTSAREEWEGNGWSGEIRPDGLHLQDLHSDDWRGEYTLDVAREVVIDYIRFLRPDAQSRADALARWEADQGRPHPARAEI